MTTQELKEALVCGCPVKSKGITYKCVSAIITRFKDKVPINVNDNHMPFYAVFKY